MKKRQKIRQRLELNRINLHNAILIKNWENDNTIESNRYSSNQRKMKTDDEWFSDPDVSGILKVLNNQDQNKLHTKDLSRTTLKCQTNMRY